MKLSEIVKYTFLHPGVQECKEKLKSMYQEKKSRNQYQQNILPTGLGHYTEEYTFLLF